MMGIARMQPAPSSSDLNAAATTMQPAPIKCHPVKTVIVLGAPRSGTSMTAGILNILGVSMGDVRSPDPLNPTGYFEDMEFLALGNDIFRAADPNSNGFRPPPAEALRQQKGKFDGRIQELITRRSLACPGHVWGWKTVSTCFLADFFLPYLPNPYFVVVLRNPVSSAGSTAHYVQHQIKKRMYDKLSLVEALQVICRYEESIYSLLARHSSIPSIVLAYENIIAEPDHSARLLTSFLNITVDEASLQKVNKFASSPRTIKRRRLRSELQRQVRGITDRIIRKLTR